MTLHIDYDDVADELYRDYQADILTNTEGNTIQEQINEIINDDVIEDTIADWCDTLCVYTCDCEEIILEYGLEEAVNLYNENISIDDDGFRLNTCAYLILQETRELTNDDIREKVLERALRDLDD